MDFDKWMAAINAILASQLCVTSEDLADFCYRDAFDNGRDPEDVAEEILDREMGSE